MKKCETCGADYKINENIPNFLPKSMQEKIKYIPNCNCYETALKRELEENEKKMQVERLKNKIKKFKDISIVDSKFDKSTFEKADMSDEHIKFCKNFSERFISRGQAPKGLLLHGTVGTGKTYASACVANELMNSGKTVLVMQLGLYLNKLQREWAEAEKEVLKQVAECDLLVIDDFGAEKVSEFVIEKTFNLIDTRYRAEKPIIITSNLNLKQIENKFTERVADRISEMCILYAVKGESKRKNIKNDEFLKFIA